MSRAVASAGLSGNHGVDSQSSPLPAAAERSYFLLGQDVTGRWVVRDKANRVGGLFVSQSEAIRYIRREADLLRNLVIVYVPEGLELDLK